MRRPPNGLAVGKSNRHASVRFEAGPAPPLGLALLWPGAPHHVARPPQEAQLALERPQRPSASARPCGKQEPQKSPWSSAARQQ